ncbi:hypothetical protein Tco_0174103 [Tanacetum coccineum]
MIIIRGEAPSDGGPGVAPLVAGSKGRQPLARSKGQRPWLGLSCQVENESGKSNFIPILVADEEVCLEIKIMQMKYYSRLYARDSESTTSATKSCKAAVNKFSELLVDIAWLLKQPFVEDMECALMSSQLQRFSFVLNFLMEYGSTIVLRKVLDLVVGFDTLQPGY